MKRIQRENNKWSSKSSDESINISRTSQLTLDSTGLNVVKKTKKVNVESGYHSRSFKLSILFLLIQLVSALLSYFVVVKDFLWVTRAKAMVTDLKNLQHIVMLFNFDSYLYHNIMLLPTEKEKLEYRASVAKYLPELTEYISDETFLLKYPGDKYQELKEKIFYKDICSLLKEDISDSTYTRCTQIRSSTFQNGLTPSFELAKLYAQSMVLPKFYDKITMTDERLYRFRDVSIFAQMALQKLVDELFGQMKSNLNLHFLLSVIIYSLLFIINLAIIFSMEGLIGKSVDSEYVFIRQIYNHFIPDDIVTQEKRLRELFKQAGIVNS